MNQNKSGRSRGGLKLDKVSTDCSDNPLYWFKPFFLNFYLSNNILSFYRALPKRSIGQNMLFGDNLSSDYNYQDYLPGLLSSGNY